MTNEMTRTAPKKIYLCVSDEPDDAERTFNDVAADEADGVCWSTDQPVACCVPCVRDDRMTEAIRLLGEAQALLYHVGEWHWSGKKTVYQQIEEFLK